MTIATSLLALLVPLIYGHLTIQKRGRSLSQEHEDHQQLRPLAAWNAALISPDIRYSGNYIIRNCDRNAEKVDAALKLLYSTLQPVIQDVEQVPPSTAYETYFKDVANAPYIRSVLSNITAGAAMSLDSVGNAHSTALGSRITTLSPEIVCVSKPGQLVYHLPNHRDSIDHYEACKERTDGGTSALITKSAHVVLCPSFFSLDPAPSEPTCPPMNRYLNRYGTRDGGKSLIHFQIYALLHPLAQFYISATSHGRVRVLAINECTRLEAEYARDNGRSYEFYVASKFEVSKS